MLKEALSLLLRQTSPPRPPARQHQGLAPEIDERTAERLAVALPVTYAFEFPGRRLEGVTNTIDLSGGGVRLVVPQMIAAQTPCHVNLKLPDQPDPLTLHGHVAWCRQGRRRSEHAFEVGIIFSQPERYDDPTFGRFSHFIASQLLTRHA